MSDRNPSASYSIDDLNLHVERVRQLASHDDPALRALFDRNSPIHIARGPGRLDIMGGIGDYSGSLVLEMPIADAAFAAAQESRDREIRIASLSQNGTEASRHIEIAAEQFDDFRKADYQMIRDALHRHPNSSWAAYVLGPILVLLKETNAQFRSGLRILIDSQVPEGKGVSSSAAVEVATMRAVGALLKVELRGEELARLCQVAENRVVGAPCGIMDQMTSALGHEHTLLVLRCQPADVEGFVPVPPELTFWGIDSGIRHTVSGSDYTSVRCGAFMGYRIIAEAAGLSSQPVGDGSELWSVDDSKWHGYLANIRLDEFRRQYEHLLPEQMLGLDFLGRYGGTTDPITRVVPDRIYAVRRPTTHPIEENARAERFRSLLQAPITSESLTEMGILMTAAHASYTTCGLGSAGTDLLVNLVNDAGPVRGLYGAKITGGGSGGSVAILGLADAGDAVEEIAQRYVAATHRPACVFSGSSPGAYGTPVAEVII